MSNRRALPVLPGRSALATVAAGASAALVALLLSVPAAAAGLAALLMLAALLVLATLDYVSSRRAWRHGQPRMTRRLPAAFAIGVRRPVELAVEVDGSARWTCELYDYADAALTTDGLPVRFEVRGGKARDDGLRRAADAPLGDHVRARRHSRPLAMGVLRSPRTDRND